MNYKPRRKDYKKILDQIFELAEYFNIELGVIKNEQENK